MTDTARIKLAKMIWPDIEPVVDTKGSLLFFLRDSAGGSFDPFNDANDDYAVLEWAINKGFSKRHFFSEALGKVLQETKCGKTVAWPWAATRYKVGDYARAACAALGIELEEGK